MLYRGVVIWDVIYWVVVWDVIIFGVVNLDAILQLSSELLSRGLSSGMLCKGVVMWDVNMWGCHLGC